MVGRMLLQLAYGAASVAFPAAASLQAASLSVSSMQSMVEYMNVLFSGLNAASCRCLAFLSTPDSFPLIIYMMALCVILFLIFSNISWAVFVNAYCTFFLSRGENLKKIKNYPLKNKLFASKCFEKIQKSFNSKFFS